MPAWGCPTSGGGQVQSHGAGAACSCKGPGSVLPRARCLLLIPFPHLLLLPHPPTPQPPLPPHTTRHRLQRCRQPTFTLLGHWCFQFSSGRNTPHSIPPPAQPEPNHSQPQHEAANIQRQLPRASRVYIRAGPSFADLIIRGFINISAAGGEGW